MSGRSAAGSIRARSRPHRSYPQTSTRNPVRGPGYRNLDVAVTRQVSLPATTTLQFRAEVFNLTNTPPLGAPNGTFGSAAFGTITSAGDPRVIQLAVKFVF